MKMNVEALIWSLKVGSWLYKLKMSCVNPFWAIVTLNLRKLWSAVDLLFQIRYEFGLKRNLVMGLILNLKGRRMTVWVYPLGLVLIFK